MKIKKLNKKIEQLPHGLAIKSELSTIHKRVLKMIEDSKKQHANQSYYQPKIKKLVEILKKNL